LPTPYARCSLPGNNHGQKIQQQDYQNRGRDEQDWNDLVVHAPSLYIQEKVHPKVLIDDLLKPTPLTDVHSNDSGFPETRELPPKSDLERLNLEPLNDPSSRWNLWNHWNDWNCWNRGRAVGRGKLNR